MASNRDRNAAAVREFFDAFGAADRSRLAAVMAEDLVWHFPPIAGDFHGVGGLVDGIRATAMGLGQGKNGFELLHVLPDEDAVVTVHRDFYVGDDNELDLRYVLYIRMKDGKMAEVWEVPFDQLTNDRYFGRQVRNYLQATREAVVAR